MSSIRMTVLGVLVALAPLGACTTAQRPSEAAVLACVQQAGVAGTFQVTTTLQASGYQVRLLEGPDVSPAQATQANLCLSRLTADPASSERPSAEPPQSVPAATPAQAMAPASCRLEMSGGSGYACAR